MDQMVRICLVFKKEVAQLFSRVTIIFYSHQLFMKDPLSSHSHEYFILAVLIGVCLFKLSNLHLLNG